MGTQENSLNERVLLNAQKHVFQQLSKEIITIFSHRGSYMSAHVLLNLLNKLRKRDTMRGLLATCLINPIKQSHECYMTLR